MSYEHEFTDGILQHDPETKYVPSGKLLSKVKIKNDDEELILIGWEEIGETLADLRKGDRVIIKGYRKFNDFTKKEEFIISQFIKREIL